MYNSTFEVLPNGKYRLNVLMGSTWHGQEFDTITEMESAHSNLVTVKRVMASMPEEIAE